MQPKPCLIPYGNNQRNKTQPTELKLDFRLVSLELIPL